MKLQLTTVSDYNYLVKGLTLYRSLKETGSDFNLNYLCLDEKSYNYLNELCLESVTPYFVDDLISSDEVAKRLQASDRWYFCMTMASYFSKHIMDNGAESVIYIDSDIYFHKNLNLMVEEFGEKEIAIFRHRQFDSEKPRPEGWFNVGVVYFKNKKFGKKILSWWSDSVLHRKHPELSTCGDQKYLDMFSQMCPEDVIYLDGNIGHGAPWQWQLYELDRFTTTGTINYRGEKQILYFTHFSQFSSDLDGNRYIPSTMHHIYTPLQTYVTDVNLKAIYDRYFEELKTTNRIYFKK